MAENETGDGKKEMETQRYLDPVKAVKKIADMALWEKSEAYIEYTGFIATLNEAVKGKPSSVDCMVTEALTNTLKLLDSIDSFTEMFPPLEQPQRFGNTAFKDWVAYMKTQSTRLLKETLHSDLHMSIPEIKVYLEDSFGNDTRIDYGTGHEMAFIMFLCCLYKVGHLVADDHVSTVVLVFNKYLQVVRKLLQTYMMEPAGSHGVWSLDDYHFVPFIWGSSQLVNQPIIYPPYKFLEEDVIEKFANDYMFISCIKYIKEVKKGPFAEHSNQLWSISAVGSWSKINQGLIKMYKKEVLSKFPVIQHVWFGSLLPIRRFPIH